MFGYVACSLLINLPIKCIILNLRYQKIRFWFENLKGECVIYFDAFEFLNICFIGRVIAFIIAQFLTFFLTFRYNLEKNTSGIKGFRYWNYCIIAFFKIIIILLNYYYFCEYFTLFIYIYM